MAALLTAAAALLPADRVPEYGPEKGTLVIQGGGSAEGTGIMETFINMAGGPNAKIIIVPTAAGNRNRTAAIAYEEAKVIGIVEKAGLTNVHMLHTADPKVADTEEFAATLRDARGLVRWRTAVELSSIPMPTRSR